jgi:AcrR family transcriptional regulator
MMAVGGGQLRRGGRTERNRKAVTDAVLQLLQEGNLNFEFQEVAALSGVHRTTLYRRWPERNDLIAEALAEHVSRVSFKFTGDWEADLRHIAYKLRDWLLDPIEQAINRLLAITEDKELYDMMSKHWPPLLARIQEPLREAQSRGELDKSVNSEILISTISSTLLTTILFLRVAPDDDFVDRLVDQLLRGCPSVQQSPALRRKAVATAPRTKTSRK